MEKIKNIETINEDILDELNEDFEIEVVEKKKDGFGTKVVKFVKSVPDMTVKEAAKKIALPLTVGAGVLGAGIYYITKKSNSCDEDAEEIEVEVNEDGTISVEF